MSFVALYNPGTASELLGEDLQKIESYLLQQRDLLKYVFNNLTPEDNYAPEARRIYLEDREKITRFDVSIDEIRMEMLTGDNVVSAINLSREGVKILGEKISLEGLVTVNSYFRVGLDGSIEARNGKFSGHISASTMDSSEITLGGNGMDGKITVKDNLDAVIGEWTKTGIDVKKGLMSGTAITLGGNGVAGSITVLDSQGRDTIGTWDASGIDVRKGLMSGTAITVGGYGQQGSITVLDALGTTTLGIWDSSGIDVRKGSITGTGITLGGSGTPGSITVLNAAGTATIGSWDQTGILVNQGVINIRGNTRYGNFGLYAGGDRIRLGDFNVDDGYGRQILQSSDEMTGMSGLPDTLGKYFLWAGWRSSSQFTFAVEHQGGYGQDNVVINGHLVLNGQDVTQKILDL